MANCEHTQRDRTIVGGDVLIICFTIVAGNQSLQGGGTDALVAAGFQLAA